MTILHFKSIEFTNILCVRCGFPAFSAVLNLLCHHYYSIYKKKSRLHSKILTFVHAEAICAQEILPIGIFFQQS